MTRYRRTCIAVASSMVATLWVGVAIATPDINSAIIRLYATRACSSLAVVEVNDYLNSLVIADSCYGGSLTNGNRHIWRLSEDGVNAAVFNNADSFATQVEEGVLQTFAQIGTGLHRETQAIPDVERRGRCEKGLAT